MSADGLRAALARAARATARGARLAWTRGLLPLLAALVWGLHTLSARAARGLRVLTPRGRAVVLGAAGALALLVALLAWDGEGRGVAARVRDVALLHQVEAHADWLAFAAEESGVDVHLLAGVCAAESSGRVGAVSSAGALGLFQLMPASASDAARRLGLAPPSREALLTDGLLNARLGANHLAWLFRHEGDDVVRVLVAYNAGRGRVQQWILQAGSWDAWRRQRERAGDSEVLAYARKVLDLRAAFAERSAFGAR